MHTVTDRHRPGVAVLAPAVGAALALVLTAWLVPTAIVTVAIGAAVFLPLERLAPLRRGERRTQWHTDLLHAVITTALAAGLTLAGAAAVLGLVRFVPTGPVARALDHLPAALQVVVALVVADVAMYWFHRAEHSVGWLWRFHRLHHSSRTVDWLAAARSHPVDTALARLVQLAPVALLGLSVPRAALYVVLTGLWHMGLHANVRLPLGPLRYVVGTPEYHQWHHDRELGDKVNFANQFPWLDALFGTLHLPAHGSGRPTLGLRRPAPDGYLAQLADPRHR